MRKTWMKRRNVCLVGAAGLATGAILACGSGFTVKRVSSDDRATEGIRFYRPWPNLVVTKEFPVAMSACFVQGTLSANGQYIDMDPATLRFINGGAWPVSGDGGVVQVPVAALQPDGTLQAGTKKLSSPSGDAGSDGGGKPPAADAGTDVSVGPGEGTKPIVLSDSMSLLYLPDESQDYVIQFNGSAQDAKLTLTSGWMLEGLNVQTQNIVANIAQNVLTSVLPSLEKLIPALQAGTTNLGTAAKAATAPAPVVIKVHTVQYAIPGIYPEVHGAAGLTPTAPDKAPIACDAKAVLPSVVQVGVFKLQTRADVLLEIQSVGGTSTAGAASGGGTKSSDGNESCASAVGDHFTTWAAGHGGGVAITPQVLSASGGKLTIAIQFGTGVTAAQKTKALKALGEVAPSVVSIPSVADCSFAQGAITVCDASQSSCKASP